MGPTTPDQAVRWFRYLLIGVLAACGAAYVVFTIHWQWMWDTQVMHYIVLALDRGKVPYRDIYDINMPGAYLTEKWALAIFGPGDLGWRLYEYTLLGTLTAAMIVIAWPVDWLAGLFAGVLFTVQLGSYGPYQAAERDEVMTVLIFVAYAFLFTAVRRRIPWLSVLFGLPIGIAILIKPTALPLALCLLLLLFFALRRRQINPWPYLLYSVAGLGIALAILLRFLLPHQAYESFFFILTQLVPYYSGLTHPSLWVMVRRSIPAAFVVYIVLALLLAITRTRKSNWETWAIWLGAAFGAISYFGQHKGYDYHRIPLVCFLLLWVGMEFTGALREQEDTARSGMRRSIAALGLAFGVLFMAPFNMRKIHAHHETNQAAYVLEDDLRQLSGPQLDGRSLDGRVQCFDMVGGCLSALYRLGIVESTGFTGDTQLFAPDDGKIVPYYRNLMLEELRAAPPSVIVFSNEWYVAGDYSFAKLDAWPAFRDYLDQNYRLETTQGPFDLYGYPMAYRIYVLKNDTAHLAQVSQ